VKRSLSIEFSNEYLTFFILVQPYHRRVSYDSEYSNIVIIFE